MNIKDNGTQVVKGVRDAIKRIGGDLPQTIPPAEHVKSVEMRIKVATPKLTLQDKDASGLLRDAKTKDGEK